MGLKRLISPKQAYTFVRRKLQLVNTYMYIHKELWLPGRSSDLFYFR